ncbi:hypothetical protein ES703_56087 [subsurface metagenome]
MLPVHKSFKANYENNGGLMNTDAEIALIYKYVMLDS